MSTPPEPEEQQLLQCSNPDAGCPHDLDREIERTFERLNKLQKEMTQLITECDKTSDALWILQFVLGGVGSGLGYLLIRTLGG